MRELAPGQTYRGIYMVEYHILALHEDFVWTEIRFPKVSEAYWPREPKSYTREFYDEMRLIDAA